MEIPQVLHNFTDLFMQDHIDYLPHYCCSFFVIQVCYTDWQNLSPPRTL